MKRKKRVPEYYDFGTALLGIEVHHDLDADPFDDPPPEFLRNASTPPSTPLQDSKTYNKRKLRLTPPRSPHPEELPPLPLASPQTPRRSGPDATIPETPASDASVEYEAFDHLTPEGTAARRSLISHAKAMFTRQHRVFLFQVVLVGRFARLIRWDRSGAVVTQRFDYVADPRYLCEFMWRFSHMSDEQRGWDHSVSAASRKEAALFKNAVQELLSRSASSRKVPNAEQTLDDTGTFPIWKIRVASSATGAEIVLIVNRPFAGHYTLRGRSTRAYLAYDLADRRLVFFKDSYRDDDVPVLPEFSTYERLRAHGVPHVPAVIYGGDVLDSSGQPQATTTQTWATVEDAWRVTDLAFHRYIHHRIVQDIAYPLETARNERELMQAVHDALAAICAASEAGILHRDISAKNIMLTADGRGILNDWDHAGSEKESAPGIGTWAFMSIRLLDDPSRIHELVDDFEAVFWVLLFVALKRFAPPDTPFPASLFHQRARDKEGRSIGGAEKRTYISGAFFRHVGVGGDVLRSLIRDCGEPWLIFYMSFMPFSDPPPALLQTFAETAKSVASPSFWLEKFAAALAKLPEPESIPDASPGGVGLLQKQATSSSTKRTAADAGVDTCGNPLRRSKRLRTVARGRD
ncbi:hypothetical protein PsYK624_081190 [Phanerochaete sordida]|uniref:Fungal-type protein kinase domain-containing protein n=1 Tax=Phanerochaete sordida TaxID=48140 RepID=A0A9P3GC85_9APHY|nr:hypothetical protein PsYK624_081190 [Phanerochaete sordida]